MHDLSDSREVGEASKMLPSQHCIACYQQESGIRSIYLLLLPLIVDNVGELFDEERKYTREVMQMVEIVA